jgi:hypothetical protein
MTDQQIVTDTVQVQIPTFKLVLGAFRMVVHCIVLILSMTNFFQCTIDVRVLLLVSISFHLPYAWTRDA